MGYPSYLNEFFDRVKLIISHYGIDCEGNIDFLSGDKHISTYFVKSSFGNIEICLDTQMLEGTIHFETLFKSVDRPTDYEYFLSKKPFLKKIFESFLRDKEIFNAIVTVDFNEKFTYGHLLDLLDASLVLKVSVADDIIDEDRFIIRYNKAMAYCKVRMFDKVDYIIFAKAYDFNYENGKLMYEGDYKQLHQEISEAYHLNDTDLTFQNFKELAQLTLMKIY